MVLAPRQSDRIGKDREPSPALPLPLCDLTPYLSKLCFLIWKKWTFLRFNGDKNEKVTGTALGYNRVNGCVNFPFIKNPVSRPEQWFPNCKLWCLRVQRIEQGPQIPLHTYMQHCFQIYIDGIMVTQTQLHLKALLNSW